MTPVADTVITIRWQIKPNIDLSLDSLCDRHIQLDSILAESKTAVKKDESETAITVQPHDNSRENEIQIPEPEPAFEPIVEKKQDEMKNLDVYISNQPVFTPEFYPWDPYANAGTLILLAAAFILIIKNVREKFNTDFARN